MEIILDGSLDNDAHVWAEFNKLICLRHLLTSTVVSRKGSVFSQVRNVVRATI